MNQFKTFSRDNVNQPVNQLMKSGQLVSVKSYSGLCWLDPVRTNNLYTNRCYTVTYEDEKA